MLIIKPTWRLLRLLGLVAAGWWRIRRNTARWTEAERASEVQAWSRRMLRCVGIELRVLGTPAAGPVMWVANHISWVDIGVMHAAGYCRFISKSEVHHWPVVGALADGAGTLYIERSSRRDAMRVMHQLVESLQAGQTIAVFPEGTTGNGDVVLPFHANLLQAPISAGAPVQPIGLKFLDAQGQTSFAPCYVGDESLLTSLWRTLSTDGLVAQVHFGTPEHAQGRDRRAWAEDLRQAVAGLR